MSLLQITNLWPPFTGQSLEVSDIVVYSPVVHYHSLEGPSQQIKPLVGPDKTILALHGPSKQIRTLTGAQ